MHDPYQLSIFQGSLDVYAPMIDAMLKQLTKQRVVERLWQGDPSLWHPSSATQARIRTRLGWLSLAPTMPDTLLKTRLWVESLRAREYIHLVCIATDEASGVVRLWRDMHPAGEDQIQLHLLDLPDASLVQSIIASLDWQHTMVLIAAAELSPELNALTNIVLDAYEQAMPEECVVVVVTAEESEVARWAKDCPPIQLLTFGADIRARFGALSPLGLVIATLLGYDLSQLHNQTQTMQAVCERAEMLESNPGVYLGTVLGVCAQQGRDKLTFIAAPELEPFASWSGNLVGGALSKHRRGLVPIVGESWGDAASYRHDRLFVLLQYKDRRDAAMEAHVAALRQAGHPVLTLWFRGGEALAAHILLWQVAVCIAAVIIGVNPFDEPDADALRAYINDQKALNHAVETLQGPFGHSVLAAQLRNVVSLLGQAEYVVLIPYLSQSGNVVGQLRVLRTLLLDRWQLPTVVVEPLRDATVATQLLHAGRSNGMMLAFAAMPPDQAVLGAPQGLDAYIRMRLAADTAAWRSMGRPHFVLNLGQHPLQMLQWCNAELMTMP